MKTILDNSSSRYNIEALARGLEILALFSAQRPYLTLSQIVQDLKMNKSTAYRVLATLQGLQYLEQDVSTRQYRPGLRVLQLGFAAINSMEVGQVIHPYLEKLSLQLSETVSLAVLSGFQATYIDRIRNQMIVGVVLGIGSSLPAHCTSLGKVLLADLPVSQLDQLLAKNELKAFTPKTLVEVEKLKAELCEVKFRGYALDDEELATGLRAAAAPIYNGSGQVIAAANVTGTIHTISYDRLERVIIPALLDMTRRVSNAMGYRPDVTVLRN